MANTLDNTLVNKILLTRGISKLQGKLPFLGAFTTDFSDDVRDQRSRSINVPFVSGGSAVQTNPTDFESGDTGSINRIITMEHISKSFYITSADYGSGTRLESLADTNMTIVANAIEAKVFALLTTTNYGTAVVGGLSGAMTGDHLKTLWASVGGDYKVAVLKDEKFASFLPTSLDSFNPSLGLSVYGFDRLDHSSTGFAAAGANIVGFGSAKSGIVMASALPEYTPEVADLLSSEVMEVPGLGIFVQSNMWASAKTRNTWASFDILFGAQVGDANALKLVSA